MGMEEKYMATLVGCAIGDTLGMPVEGWKPAQIKKYAGKVTSLIDPVKVYDADGKLAGQDEFGKLKYYSRDLKKGDYTDDTALTLALAESIAEKKCIDLDDIAKKQLESLDEYNAKYANSGFGQTTRDALENIRTGKSPLESGVIGGPGNGPAMKMAPLGLYLHAQQSLFGKYSYASGINLAEDISRITHLDPRSIASGIVQAISVNNLLNNISRDHFIDSVVEICEDVEEPVTLKFRRHEDGNLLSRLEWVSKNRDASCDEAYGHLKSSSLVYSSHPFTLFMFQKFWDDPIAGLIETVNYGGDCDTTGAMYGALAGAKNGMIFPEEWVKATQGVERLTKAAKGIYALR